MNEIMQHVCDKCGKAGLGPAPAAWYELTGQNLVRPHHFCSRPCVALFADHDLPRAYPQSDGSQGGSHVA